MRRPVAILLMLAAGCLPGGDEDLPGEVIGEFEVQGLMVLQSCGAAVPAPDPLDLEFELRLEDNTRAFYRLSGGNTFAGTVSEDEYTFQASQTFTVIEPDARIGYAGCTVTQRDTFTFLLETSTEEDSSVDKQGEDTDLDTRLMTLVGTQATDIEPLQGSDCRPAVTAFGGNFQSLPCRIEYALTGIEL